MQTRIYNPQGYYGTFDDDDTTVTDLTCDPITLTPNEDLHQNLVLVFGSKKGEESKSMSCLYDNTTFDIFVKLFCGFHPSLSPEKKRENKKTAQVSKNARSHVSYSSCDEQSSRIPQLYLRGADEEKYQAIKSALGGPNDLEQAIDFVRDLNLCAEPNRPKKQDPNAPKTFLDVFCVFKPPIPLKRNGKPAIPMRDDEVAATDDIQSTTDLESGVWTDSAAYAPLRSANLIVHQILRCLFWSCYDPQVMDDLAYTFKKGTYKSQ